MTKYILHGGFTGEKNKLNEAFYTEITKNLSEDSKVLLIYFARDEEDYGTLFGQDKEWIEEVAKNKKLITILANKKDFIEQIKDSEAIFFRGGSTDQLLRTLKTFPDFAKSIENKVVAGSSAGAYIFSKYYHSASKGGVHEGLGILPIRIICHYKSESGKFDHIGDEAIEEIKKYPKELELVILKDFEWKIFTK